jgi:predicted transcriptional regulator
MATQMSPSQPARTALDQSVETTDLLEMLGDEYTRRVLAAVTERPRSGREVMDAADVSKATAYRRLGDLEDAGLVESEMVFDPDVHHHEQFHAVVESVAIEFGPDGPELSVETAETEADAQRNPYRRK